MPRKDGQDPVISTNRKAFHDYAVLDRFEAGIKLVGSEVKSCRARQVSMQDSYVDIDKGTTWVRNLYVAPYEQTAVRFNHDAKAPRRLLMHKREILKLSQQIKEKGLTLIPLKMYFSHGLVKLELGICRGKSHADKRDSMREKQDMIDVRRAASQMK